jgi:predicted amidophosphoribosyltransferase
MSLVYLYKDSLRILILKFKYSDRSFLAKDFGLSMYETMKLHSFYNDAEFIMQVPLNIARRIKRGYNQAELLANGILIKASIPILKKMPCLERKLQNRSLSYLS